MSPLNIFLQSFFLLHEEGSALIFRYERKNSVHFM